MASIVIYTETNLTEAQVRKLIQNVVDGSDPEEVRVTAKKKPVKNTKALYGEVGLVKMTEAEYKKLVDSLGKDKTSEMILRLERYVGSTGKKYNSHYMTILNWVAKDDKENVQTLFGKPGQVTMVDQIKGKGGRVI